MPRKSIEIVIFRFDRAEIEAGLKAAAATAGVGADKWPTTSTFSAASSDKQQTTLNAA